MNEGILDAVEAGVPVLYSPGPLMGATGPATVAGTVALTIAEVLFGVVLVQAIRAGAPVVLKPAVDVFDMSRRSAPTAARNRIWARPPRCRWRARPAAREPMTWGRVSKHHYQALR